MNTTKTLSNSSTTGRRSLLGLAVAAVLLFPLMAACGSESQDPASPTSQVVGNTSDANETDGCATAEDNVDQAAGNRATKNKEKDENEKSENEKADNEKNENEKAERDNERDEHENQSDDYEADEDEDDEEE